MLILQVKGNKILMCLSMHIQMASVAYLGVSYIVKVMESHFLTFFFPKKFSGDLGQTFNSLSTLDHYMQSGGQAVLFVGDLSYADRYEHEHENGIRWDSWGRFIEKSAAYQPWLWSAGNHEIEYMPHVVIFFPTPFLIIRMNNDSKFTHQ